MVKQVLKPGEVQRNFVPETCEYYLQYDVSRPLPKKWR